MNWDKRIKDQEAAIARCERKIEDARSKGQEKRLRLWELQREVEEEALDELLIEEMVRNFATAMGS